MKKHISSKLNEKTYKLPMIKHEIAVIFHVGNYDVFFKIYHNNIRFFKRKNMLVFITLHDKEYVKRICKYIPNAIFSVIENKGMDVGGKLKSMKLFFKHPSYINIKFIYFFHTKTNDEWRKQMILPLTNFFQQNEVTMSNREEIPLIIGSKRYCYKNNKGINRMYIKDIFDRNRIFFNRYLKKDWNIYLDNFYNENNEYTTLKNTDINSIHTTNIYQNLKINFDFVRSYESDLKQHKDHEIIEHRSECGKNEFHRLYNPCHIKKFSEESYFIAGTSFMCNKEYIKIFENINFDYEYSILEHGYIINSIPRKTHSWEYLFGLLAYSRNGYIISIDENGKHNDMTNKTNIFDADIYKNCNPDLPNYDENELFEDYNKYGKYENRISTKKGLYKPQLLMNNQLSKAKIAILLPIPLKNNHTYYENILLRVLNLSKLYEIIDLYFGDENNGGYHTYNGLCTIYESIHQIVNRIELYDILNISSYNFYLGLNLQREYDRVEKIR